MANRVIQRFFLSVALPGLLAFFVAGCSGKSDDAGKVIFTQAPSASVDAASVQNGTYKYADGLQIVMGQTMEEPQSMEVLLLAEAWNTLPSP